jgi:hypothetical protein
VETGMGKEYLTNAEISVTLIATGKKRCYDGIV